MSKLVTYTLYAEVGGAVGIGLSPSFATFKSVSDGVTIGELPVIEEIGEGFYKYSFDWALVSEDSYLVKIDLGETTPPGERYIINRLERHDYLPSTAASIEASAELIKTKADSILASAEYLEALVTRLLDIEEGEWQIANNQLVIKDSEGNEITKFNLFGATGSPTNSNPYRRVLTYQSPRPTK